MSFNLYCEHILKQLLLIFCLIVDVGSDRGLGKTMIDGPSQANNAAPLAAHSTRNQCNFSKDDKVLQYPDFCLKIPKVYRSI